MRQPQKIERIDGGASGRLYGVEGRKLPSITNVVGVLDKPALVPWAAGKERDAAIAAAKRLRAEGAFASGITDEEFDAIFREAMGSAKAHVKELESAGAIGTSIHEQIERGLRKEMDLPAFKRGASTLSEASKEAARTAYASYEEWKVKSQFKPRMIEQMVYSLEHGYAGTFDVLGDHLIEINGAYGPERYVSITDWKSSSALYLSAHFQISAYRQAVLEMELHDPAVPLNGLLVRLPKDARDPTIEVRFVSEAEMIEYFKGFMACRLLWQAVQDYESKYPWQKRKKAAAA